MTAKEAAKKAWQCRLNRLQDLYGRCVTAINDAAEAGNYLVTVKFDGPKILPEVRDALDQELMKDDFKLGRREAGGDDVLDISWEHAA